MIEILAPLRIRSPLESGSKVVPIKTENCSLVSVMPFYSSFTSLAHYWLMNDHPITKHLKVKMKKLILLFSLLTIMFPAEVRVRTFVVNPFEMRFQVIENNGVSAIGVNYYDCRIAIIPVVVTGNGVGNISREEQQASAEVVKNRVSALNRRMSEGNIAGKDIELTLPKAIFVNNLENCAKDYPNAENMLKFVELEEKYDESHDYALTYLASKMRLLELRLGHTVFLPSFPEGKDLVVDPSKLSFTKSAMGSNMLSINYFGCEMALVNFMGIGNDRLNITEELVIERVSIYMNTVFAAKELGMDIQISIPDVIYVHSAHYSKHDYPNAEALLKLVPKQNKYQNDLHYAFKYVKVKSAALRERMKKLLANNVTEQSGRQRRRSNENSRDSLQLLSVPSYNGLD